MHNEAKQVVYRYDADDSKNETVVDMLGEVETPKQGHVIERNGRKWKVVMVTTERTLSPNPPIPIVTVILTSNLDLAVQVHR
jgi:hypothetical protein